MPMPDASVPSSTLMRLSPMIEITADWCWTKARNCEEKPRLGTSTPYQNIYPAQTTLSIKI